MTTTIPIRNDDGGSGGDAYPPVAPSQPVATQPTTSPTPSPTPPATTPTPSQPATPASAPAPTARTASVVQSTIQTVPTVLIPLSPVPSQTLAVTLGNQSCTIKVYTRATGLYLDLYLSDMPICMGVACLDRNIIVRAAYLGFQGELMVIDAQGASDPTYDGLGERYNLVWLNY